jgi:gliding motility-associated-like protein
LPTISGTSGGVFTSSPVGLSLNASTGRISIGTSTIGTYNVTYTTGGSCPDDSTISIVINPQPSVNNISDQNRCFGDSFNPITFTGSNNTIFNWTNSNSTIGLASSGSGNISAFVAKGTVFGGSSIAGNVVVTPEINGCSGSTKTFILTVNPIDNPAFHYSDNSFCTTQVNPAPSIDGTLGGVFTSTPLGLSINSATGLINLGASTAGTYQIKYTTPGNCKDDSTVTIGIGSNPSVDDVDDQSYCQGDMFDAVIFSGNPGTVFQWVNNNSSVGIATSGTGNIAAFKAQGTVDGGSDLSATITITPRIGTCVGSIVNYKYKVRANPKIVASIANTTKQDTSFCKGGSVVLSATGASKNENYIWTPHTSLAGNIGIGSSVTTKTDTTQQYIVRGQSQFGCFNYDTLLVNVYNPTVNQKSDTTVCAGSTINGIQFISSLPGTTFDWSNSNGNIGLGFNGTGNINTFTAKNTTASAKQTGIVSVTPKYVIQSLNRTCTGPVMRFSIAVNKQDDPTFSGYLAQYCANETANTIPTVTGAKGGIFSALPTGLALNSNTGEIFPISSKAGSYSVKYTTNGACPKADSTYLFINPLITASITGADTVCVNAVAPQIKFKGSNGVAPYVFKYKINGGAVQTISTDPGKDEISVAAPTNKAGIFTYELISVEESSASRCINNNVFGVQNVIVNELPTAQITSTSSTVCVGSTSPEIRITGINGVSPFTFTYFISKDGNPFGPSQNISTTLGQHLAKIPVNTSQSGVYNYTVNIVKNGDDLSCSNNINISQVVTVKPAPNGTVTAKPAGICMNGDANIEFTASNGTPPFTFVYSINNGGNQTIKTANNDYSVSLKANTGMSGVFNYKIVSVSDGDATSCQNNSVVASTDLTITPGTKVNKIQDINVCVNEKSDTIQFTGGANGTTYTWYSNNTTIGLAGSGSGDIMPFVSKNNSGSTTNIARITVIPSVGQCKGDTMKFDVVVRPKPKAKINAPNTVCPGDSIRLEGIGSELKYVWTPNVSCITCNPVIAKPTENTTYKAFVTDKYNCYDSTEFDVVVYRKPDILIDEPVVCGDPELVTLKGKGTNTYTYSDGILDGVPFMPAKGKTSYIVTVKDNLGCKNTDTVNVYVVDKPISKFTASPESGLASDIKPLNVLLTNKSTNASSFEWYFRNGEESPVVKTTLEPVTALYKKPGIYVVTLIAQNGKCIDSSSISIKIDKLDTPRVEIAPNVFTPDNDGTNDVFFLTVKNAKNIHITIFNRWGNPIHEITETTQSWDGRINGKDADEGVYYYQYEIEGSSGEKIKGQGYVQLIRK